MSLVLGTRVCHTDPDLGWSGGAEFSGLARQKVKVKVKVKVDSERNSGLDIVLFKSCFDFIKGTYNYKDKIYTM